MENNQVFEKVKDHSMDITDENIKKIGELFPEVMTESVNQDGKLVHAIDFEKLKQLLSNSLIDERERYDFTWVGKNKAILEAGQPIEKTLRPLKEKSVDWDNTENVYIEGDNLEVLKLLQESYLNKIDVIYIDPPYNTGNDFIYNDDFKMSEEEYSEAVGEFDEYNQRMIPSKKDNARFHSDWLNMMYSRLKLAKNLLSDDGVIFISIDNNEQAHLKELCDEIFGEYNVEVYIWDLRDFEESSFTKTASNTVRFEHEYILSIFKSEKKLNRYQEYRFANKEGLTNPDNDPRGVWFSGNISRNGIKTTTGEKYYTITTPTGIEYSRNWTISKNEYEELLADNRIYFSKNGNGVPRQKIFKNDLFDTIQSSIFSNVKTSITGKNEIKELFDKELFSFPKPTKLISRLITIGSHENATILDFFSGSGTTADAVMQLNAKDGGNRKFIMVQLPEEIDEKQEAYKEGYRYITEIGEERIRRAGKKVKEEHPEVDTGFRVFKVDSPNMESTYKTPDKVNQQNLLSDIRNVKEGRNDLDLLYQVMLDWGLELSLPYQVEMIENTKIHNVFDDTLLACFSDELNSDVIRKMAEKKPLRVVFKDSSFKDSATKINVNEIFKEMSPETKIKVI